MSQQSANSAFPGQNYMSVWSVPCLNGFTLPFIFQTYLKEILKEICTYNMKAPHRNMWELKPEYRHYKEQQSSGWPSVTDQGQGRLHILPRSFDFLFQNYKKHHFHVYLHPSLDYTRVSPRFWDSATVISIIVIKLAKTLDDFFYYFIGFMELGFFSTTVMNEVLFSIPGMYILKWALYIVLSG